MSRLSFSLSRPTIQPLSYPFVVAPWAPARDVVVEALVDENAEAIIDESDAEILDG